ncbi:MAG TPA: hypothetical protein VGL94_22515 [Ktedonobacteraceae bacterium]|jgi:hypothetical protein
MTRITPTTTLIVSEPIDFRRLEAHYRLIRYELPVDLHWKAKKDSNAYGQMHNSLRDQLDCPYKAFKYDRLDGGIPKWVVYALYPRDATPATIKVEFLSIAPLSSKEVPFDHLDLHLLLKLLQIAYVRGDQVRRFIGQDLCYVHAKKEGNSHICLQIDLKEDIRMQPGDIEREFKVIGQARLFRPVSYPTSTVFPYTYFGRKITHGKVYFLHLKKSEVETCKQTKEPLYAIRTRPGKRTTLVYHDQRHIEESVGKLLYDFIQDFIAFLARYRIMCRSKERNFTEFVPPKGQAELPLTLLNPIAVFDNRLNKARSLQDYLDIFTQFLPELHFTPVEDLLQVGTQSIFVIQDYNKEDFEQGGILEGQVDPYASLYRKYPQLPKQSINVNLNKQTDTSQEAYLDYPLPRPNDKNFKLKLDVALAQLYLKDVICYERSGQQRLPLLPTQFAFIRKDSYFSRQSAYETLLYFENDTLHFLDLRDHIQQDRRDELLARMGIDWEAMYEDLLRKYRKKDDQDERKDLSSYDIIVGPGLFIELEDLNERVLYDYSEIIKRQAAVDMLVPIEEFKLLSHYDVIRKSSYLSASQLSLLDLLRGQVLPKNDNEAESLKFYLQLEEYDAFLGNLQQSYQTISFNMLSQNEHMEQIRSIFDIQPDKNGQYNRRQFKGYYQKRGWFSSDKAKDVHMYGGIWYDDYHCYMVGSLQSMNQQQPRAHLIRRFNVYQGADHFDIRPLLLATSVQFVRLNQYTVYPYAFHLIDLYVENILRFR